GGVGTANVPTDAFRNGDLSALLNRHDNTTGAQLPSIQIFDPFTGTPFPGNIIPADRIQPAAKALIAFWPQAQRVNSDPLSGINYIGTGNIKVDDDQKFVRIDHELTSKDRLFGHYVIDDISYTNLNASNPHLNYFVVGRNQSAAGQWVHIFSPQLVNEFRFGYMRSVDNTLNPRSNTTFSLDAIGLTGFHVLNDNNRPFTARETGVPPVNIQNFLGLGDVDGGNGFDFNNQWQWSDNVSMNRGSHNFKTGVDITRIALFRGAANVARGDLNFNGDIAGNAFAAFLLGVPSQTDSPEGLPLTDSRQTRYGVYFEDDWKTTRKLTLNLGLRWEYNTSAVDVDGLWRSLDFRHTENGLPVLLPAIRTKNYQFYDPEKTLFMPRLGFAYRATDKWVLRGGGGIFYNVHQLNNYTILNLNPPLSGSSSFVNTPVNGVLKPGTPMYTYQNPFGTLNTTSIINANTLNPDNFEPRIMQWSLDLQRRLPFDSVLTVGYVGNHGVHIDNTVELNNPDPAPNTASTAQQRRPYQYVVDGPGGPVRPISRIRWLDSGGLSWYHGLEVNWLKRFSRGLQFNVAYTYSKAEGTGYGRNESFGATNNGSYQNPRDRAADKSVYPFDVTHNAVINFIYEIPGFKTSWARFILGGWQANGIWTIRTGFPFTVMQTNTLNTFNSPVRPDRIGSGKLANPTVNLWFNPNDFQIVTCNVSYLLNTCHYGNSGNGILRGPGFNNLDFGLSKNFRITERINVQFRAEAFNIANHPNFNTPNATLTAAPGFYPTQNATTGAIGAYPSQITTQGPGSITSLISPMRVIQFGLKFRF
ncbi:MAG: TonB-dependent receptor, partial [Acidobacteriaceae bacterium]|nr:TonB-dependent receptor [Acidobacteriaceae bacterium]